MLIHWWHQPDVASNYWSNVHSKCEQLLKDRVFLLLFEQLARAKYELAINFPWTEFAHLEIRGELNPQTHIINQRVVSQLRTLSHPLFSFLLCSFALVLVDLYQFIYLFIHWFIYTKWSSIFLDILPYLPTIYNFLFSIGRYDYHIKLSHFNI